MNKEIHVKELSKKLVGIFTLITCLLSLWATRNTTIDDSFISWKEGLNFIHEGKFVFNAHAESSNGATSTLYGLLSAFPVALNIDVLLFFKFISILSIIGFVGLSTKAKNFYFMCAFLLLSIGTLGIGIHIWGGLETSMVVLISTYLIIETLESNHTKRNDIYFILSALLIWIRLDFILLTISLSILKIWNDLSGNSSVQFGQLLRLIIKDKLFKISFISVVAQLLFLKLFSGNFLPTSVMRKSFQNFTPIPQIIGNVYSLGFWGAIALILILSTQSSVRKQFIVIFVTFSCPLAIVYIVSDLQMDFAGRFGYMTFWPLALSSLLATNKNLSKNYFLAFTTWLLVFLNLTYINAAQLVTFYPRLVNSVGRIGSTIGQVDQKIFIAGGDAGLLSYLANVHTFLDTNELVSKKPQISFLNKILRENNAAIVVVAVTPSLSKVNFMENQKYLANWAESKNLVYLGATAFDTGYFNHIWVSNNLDFSVTKCLEKQIKISKEVLVPSTSLGLKSNMEFNWKIPKFKCEPLH